jgi:hypothetical protein
MGQVQSFPAKGKALRLFYAVRIKSDRWTIFEKKTNFLLIFVLTKK